MGAAEKLGRMRTEGILFIGHDVGTGGAKSVIVSSSGDILASSFEPYEIVFPSPGFAVQDPLQWWRAVCVNTNRMIQESMIDPARIGALAFAGQMITILPVSPDGEPLMDAITWLDSRAEEQAKRIIRRLGGKRVMLAFAGALPSGKDIVCKIQWLKENEPEIFSMAKYILDATAWLVFRATGNFVIDDTAASGTGVFDIRRRRWSPVLTRIVSFPVEKFPPVQRCTQVVGYLKRDAAEGMGLTPGIPVIAGMSDIPAAASGSGALDECDAHFYLGTSSWLCISSSRPVNIGRCGMVSIASPDPAMFMVLGESETAGLCLDWFFRNIYSPWLRKDATSPSDFHVNLDRTVEDVEPGAGGVIFTPWLFGERSPVTDTSLRASFFNLSFDHTIAHMLRAVYEGVAFNLRWMIESAERKGFGIKELRAIGGGAKSDVWLKIIADVTKKRIHAVSNPQDAGALGVALAGAAGLGLFTNYSRIKDAVRVRHCIEPDNSLFPLYDNLYDGFKMIYPALSKVSCRLGAGMLQVERFVG